MKRIDYMTVAPMAMEQIKKDAFPFGSLSYYPDFARVGGFHVQGS